MSIYTIFLISKSGSLLYQKDFPVANSPIVPQNSNAYLVIASTLHGVHAIASKLTPKEAMGNYRRARLPTNSNKFGLRSISTDKFNIYVNQTVTGLKIIILTSKDVAEEKTAVLENQIYGYYADYVLKNPFYRLDMPIRLQSFEESVTVAVGRYNVK